jgi:2-polyprenyl-3-methyl-5-hydroxy-6-metoxy-1,4-benzoquinol methylase
VWRYRQTCRSVVRAPEFQEYFVHYPIKHSKYSSHYTARQLVGSGQDVLDMGCGEGFFAAELKKDGNRIVGVDALPSAGEHGALEQYISADLNAPQPTLRRELGDRKFDRVLLLDLLEHLLDPENLLREVRPTLKENGRLIVSLPNVANITVRVALLFGRFTYTDRGILDRTHLHLYTRRTARALLENAGWEILEARTTVMPLELVLGWDPEKPLMRTITAVMAVFTKIFPGLFGYQLVYLARPRG